SLGLQRLHDAGRVADVDGEILVVAQLDAGLAPQQRLRGHRLAVLRGRDRRRGLDAVVPGERDRRLGRLRGQDERALHAGVDVVGAPAAAAPGDLLADARGAAATAAPVPTAATAAARVADVAAAGAAGFALAGAAAALEAHPVQAAVGVGAGGAA